MAGRDAREAIAIAEGAVTRRMLLAVDGVEPAGDNALGEKVVVERAGAGGDVRPLLHRAVQAMTAGERVAVVATASSLASARRELAHVSSRGLGLVVHCIEDDAVADPLDETGASSALSLGDLPWGMLVAVGAAESLDLSLVARRAAEDSGCPFFVVHERSQRAKQSLLVAPGREMVESFLGGAQPAVRPAGDARGIGERVPFALGSALREMEALSVHRLDVIERTPATEAAVALVALGAVGESVLAEVERMRAEGQDVMAIRLLAWRPFPGPRLVRALGRAGAVTVIDSVERPLGGGGPLAVDMKAAFSDALTWAPGYPGIGRIPRIASGACPRGLELSRADVAALVDNMHADERGTRSVTLPRRVAS